MNTVWIAKRCDWDGCMINGVYSTKELGLVWLKKMYERELLDVKHMNEFEEERNYRVKHEWTISSIIEEEGIVYFDNDIETYSIVEYEVK